MKTPEEIEKKITETLKKYKESYAPWELEECSDCHPYERENMIEFGKEIYKQAIKEIWDAACEAQMNEVYEHCTHTPNTNYHAIKFWVKTPKMPEELKSLEK
jgi:hypothetical protein